MTSRQKRSGKKRKKYFRDVNQTDDFLKQWDRLEESGQHDMQRLKEAMMLLAANNEPLSPEWKDHALTGKFEGCRECHVKGDLLLIYRIKQEAKIEVLVFLKTGTHSELFG